MTFSITQKTQVGYSSWLQKAEWNSWTKRLLLTTKEGKQIHIRNVNRDTFLRFSFSTSAGKFFHRHLKHNVIKGGE